MKGQRIAIMRQLTCLLARAFVTVIVLFAIHPALSADTDVELLDALTGRLDLQPALRGEFRQFKQLPFLDQPFVSTGTFQLSRSEGLIWQVLTPGPSLMEVRESKVTLDGHAVQDHGIGGLMSRLMLGLMDGDLAGVTRYFSLQGDATSTPWQLTLTPRGRLSRALQAVQLSGDRYLQELVIVEVGDASTAIEFTEVHPPLDAKADNSGDHGTP